MKSQKIALAVTLLIMAKAHAVTRISGSSELSVAYIDALSTNNACLSNKVSIFKRGTSSTTLGNHFTIKCDNGNFAGTTENEIQFDVTGGSLNAILYSARGASEYLASDGRFLSSTTSCGTAVTIAAGPLAFASGKIYNCSDEAALTSGKSVGGVMAVEPNVFLAQGVIAGDYSDSVSGANFSQVFGVAASKDLYEALQTDQGLTVGSTAPANQPSISRAQIVSMMNSNDFNDAKNKGPKFLVPSTNKTNITYCRQPSRVDKQAVAELYFLQNPSASGVLGGLSQAHGPADWSGSNQVVVNNGMGNTFTVKLVGSNLTDMNYCLNLSGFAFGVVSATYNPVGQGDSYRFVKLSGQGFSEGVAGGLQKAAAINGRYDFVFEGVMFNPTGSPVVDLINSRLKFQVGAGYPGLFLNINSSAPESSFTRFGNSLGTYESF